MAQSGQGRALKTLGRTDWKTQSGYSRRSYVETVMHRFKQLTGAALASRKRTSQKVELLLRCKLLNLGVVPTGLAF